MNEFLFLRKEKKVNEKTIIDSVKMKNHEIAYAKFGNGVKTMVIIPGLSLESVLKVAELVRVRYTKIFNDYTIYLLDRDKAIDEQTTLDDLADITAKAMIELEITDAYLIGLSQGGIICEFIAANYPKLVKKLALVSTTCKVSEENNKLFEKWKKSAEQYNTKELNKSFFKYVYSKEHIEANKNAFNQAAESLGNEKDCKRMSYQLMMLQNLDYSEIASKINCDTLVLGSKKDEIFLEGQQRDLAEKVGCKIYLFDGYAHAVYDETDELLEKVKEFYNR